MMQHYSPDQCLPRVNRIKFFDRSRRFDGDNGLWTAKGAPCSHLVVGDFVGFRAQVQRLPDFLVIPPSITYDAPVMYAAWSDAKNAQRAAISSGLAIRCKGISERSLSYFFESAFKLASIGVSTAPGQILLTVIPYSASSTAIVRISMRRPPFAAQYGAFVGMVTSS